MISVFKNFPIWSICSIDCLQAWVLLCTKLNLSQIWTKSFWLKQHHLIHRIQTCILPLRPVHHVSLTSCISLTSCNQLLKRNWLNPVFNSNLETWITSSDPSVQWIAYSHVFCLWDIRGHNSKGPPGLLGSPTYALRPPQLHVINNLVGLIGSGIPFW